MRIFVLLSILLLAGEVAAVSPPRVTSTATENGLEWQFVAELPVMSCWNEVEVRSVSAADGKIDISYSIVPPKHDYGCFTASPPLFLSVPLGVLEQGRQTVLAVGENRGTPLAPISYVFGVSVPPEDTIWFGRATVGDTVVSGLYRINNPTATLLTDVRMTLRPMGGCGISPPTPSCGSFIEQEYQSFAIVKGCSQIAIGGYCDVQIAFSPFVARNLHVQLQVAYADYGGLRGADIYGTGEPAQLTPGTVLAVEFYNAVQDHYFITDRTDEQALLDQGVMPGWTRTGFSFWVWPATGGAPPGTSPVCRFYGRPEAGINSHFYSASPAECAAVASKFADAWILESPTFFYAYLPDTNTGACPEGATPVYRYYNQKADAGHRYLPVHDFEANRMLARSWIPEGYGPQGVVMCGAPGRFAIALQ